MRPATPCNALRSAHRSPAGAEPDGASWVGAIGSILLLWAGGALALVSWVLALGFVLLVPMFVARCRLEERLLVAHFGPAYVAYAARVPMLVPRLTPYRPQPTPHA